ncbi:MAG: methyltransferase [Candidatus Binatia bacterium]
MRLGSLSSLGALLTSSPVFQEGREPESGEDPSDLLLRLIRGFWASGALHAAAKLRVADYLVEAPLCSEALACMTGTHAPSLYRLLRALASVGVLAEDESGYFSLTKMGKLLRADKPDSFHSFVMDELGDTPPQAWKDLFYSVKVGRPARSTNCGAASRFTGRRGDEKYDASQNGLDGASARLRAAILRDYDFSQIKAIVDIGGGNGTFLAFLLQAHDLLRGIVFDFPWALETTQFCLTEEGVTKRCKVLPGDFLKTVPSGHDLYILKKILQTYSDEHAVAILKNCHRAMLPQSKLLLVEAVIPSGNASSVAKLQDLKLMITSEGRERTEHEFRTLCRQARLRLQRVFSLNSEASILEVVRG